MTMTAPAGYLVEVPQANGNAVPVPLDVVEHDEAAELAAMEELAQETPAAKRAPNNVLGDSKGEKWIVGVLATLLMALAVDGMFVSFTTVQFRLAPWFTGYHRSAAVPLGIDIGILVFGMTDILLTYWKIPTRLPRLLEWALVGATAWLNVSGPEPWWVRAAHIMMPSLWAAAVEVVRIVIRVRLLQIEHKDLGHIRVARWFLSPWPTFRMWRVMMMWDVTYEQALERELNRLACYSRAMELYPGGRSWKNWSGRSSIPGDIRLRIKLGNITPADIPGPAGADSSGGHESLAMASLGAMANSTAVATAPAAPVAVANPTAVAVPVANSASVATVAATAGGHVANGAANGVASHLANGSASRGLTSVANGQRGTRSVANGQSERARETATKVADYFAMNPSAKDEDAAEALSVSTRTARRYRPKR